ncbi:MAG: polyprenyl synthetase family protein [Chloroflexi bacterium]|nr:polyprenyl synthetase family protein [Chloroflexota bacterium]
MDINSILAPIQSELQTVEVRLREAIHVEFEPLANVFETLIGSGGKRIRPALSVLSTKFHPTDPDKALTLAISTELVHAATLIHDDLIDKSPLRRGSPTVNSRWSGTATVLAGDFLLARAADIAASLDNFRVMRLFARTLMAICDGEIRQDFGGAHWPPNREAYYRHIDSKTASLFVACTESGAILSSASEDEITALRDFGHNLGRAFQIADDILDFTADQRALGKPVGSDLRQGTLTLPVFYFVEQDPRGAQVEETLQLDAHDGPEMDRLIEAIRQSPAIAASKAEARRHVQAAQESLTILPNNSYRQALHNLANYVVDRTT